MHTQLNGWMHKNISKRVPPSHLIDISLTSLPLLLTPLPSPAHPPPAHSPLHSPFPPPLSPLTLTHLSLPPSTLPLTHKQGRSWMRCKVASPAPAG